MNTLGEKPSSTFATDHLYLAGFLVCRGHLVVGTSPRENRVAFEFTETAGLLSDVAAFMSGAPIPARQFSFEILKLKRTIHENVEPIKYTKMYKNEKTGSFNR